MNHDYLFPARLTRRDFLKAGTLAAASLAIPAGLQADEPVKFGSGPLTFTLDPTWGTLPQGMKYGYGCGIAVDSKDRIFVTSRSESPCVAIFDPSGKILETWSNEFPEKVGMQPGQVKATAHCIYISKEGDQEYIYFTENEANKGALGRRVYKTDMTGKVLYMIGNVATEDATHQKFLDWTNPTDVAVSANGDIYTVDGYGSQKVSRFTKDWKHLKTFGKPGKGQDEFNTCHGVWVNTLKGHEEIYIADRANGRIQVYDPELTYQRTIKPAGLRNPCCFYQQGGYLFIPDLGGQVLVLDKDDQLVATLGDGKAAEAAEKKRLTVEGKPAPVVDKNKLPEFIAPHALTVDSKGNLYVLEWVPYGRVRKLNRVTA